MLVTVITRAVELVIVREDKSLELLSNLGVTNCVRSVDAGFLLELSDSKSAGISKLSATKHKCIIGVTARKWLKDAQQKNYEKAITETLDYLINKYNAYIVFIPQVTAEFHNDDDRIINEEILSEMVEKKHTLLITDNYNYREIKAMYNKLDYILGTRFHSVIFSLTSYVPALAIEYEHKTSGIMHDLGLEEWVIRMEDITPRILESKMDNLIKYRVAYKAHLHRVLPQYIQQAHEAIKLVKHAYKISLNTN